MNHTFDSWKDKSCDLPHNEGQYPLFCGHCKKLTIQIAILTYSNDYSRRWYQSKCTMCNTIN